MAVNRVTLIGNIGHQPESRRAGESHVCSFTVAVTEKRKDTQYTEWVNIETWNKTAEFVMKYASKGSKVYIEGALRTDMWEHEGVKKYRTKVVAQKIELLSGWKEQTEQQQVSTVRQATPPPDDDMPF